MVSYSQKSELFYIIDISNNIKLGPFINCDVGYRECLELYNDLYDSPIIFLKEDILSYHRFIKILPNDLIISE